MTNLCRLCSSQSPTLTPVFSIKNGRLLLDMITLICPVKIDISDNLPKAICNLCLRIILDAVDLRERSILSDLNLRSQLGTKLLESVKIPEFAKPQQEEVIPRMSTPVFSTPFMADAVKIEEEREESNVINYVDESQMSHEDYHGYDNEQGYEGEPAEFSAYEPPMKLQKREGTEQKCSNCQCHKTSAINHELNERIKEYFRKPLEKGGKWKCHICQKEYAGHLNNLKEHLSIMHKDIAQMLGVCIKPRVRRNDKIKIERPKMADLSMESSLAEYLEQKNSDQFQ